MRTAGEVEVSGELGLRVIRGGDEPATSVPARPLNLEEVVRYGCPQKGLPEDVNRWRRRNAKNLMRGARKLALARLLKLPHFYGQLSLVHIKADGSWVDLGLASQRVVTTVGGGYIVDAWQNSVELENMKYHGIGTGGTAEAVGDTALVTESTTALNPDSTRATGSTTEASALVFRTVGTNLVDGAVACTEHGIFSQAATGGGVLMDRTLFTVVNLASADSLQTTYDFTIVAGS